MRGLILNPVLAKEFRSRMRTWKSPLVLSAYLGILALITLGYYWTQQERMVFAGFGPDIGPRIYVTLSIFQLLLVSFVTPAFTAGMISGERERQTLDLLICTRLSATSIVLNKLVASVSYILLLIIASLPVFGIVYFFGGVRLADIGQVMGVCLMTALTFGAVGIFCSSLFKRTQVSVVITYIIVFFFLVGTVAIAAFLMGLAMRSGGNLQIPFVAYLNPVIAMCSAFPGQFAQGIPLVDQIIFSRGGYGVTAAAGAQTAPELLAPWQYNLIGDGIIILVLLAITVLIITPVGRCGWLKRLRGRRRGRHQIKDEGNMEARV